MSAKDRCLLQISRSSSAWSNNIEKERAEGRKKDREIEKKKKVKSTNIDNSISISTAGDCGRF